MSLINDMLRDLSARQAASPAYAANDGSLVQGEQEQLSRFFSRSTPWPIIILSLVLFLLVFISVRWFFQEQFFSSKEAPAIISSQVEARIASEIKPVLNQSTQFQSQLDIINTIEEPVDQPAILEVVTSPQQDLSTAAEQQTIYQLIDKASRALALDRLTSPEEDNAWFYYQSLLQLDAENAIALEGMTRIVSRYLEMTGSALKKQDIERAINYFEKAKMVASNLDLPEKDKHKLISLEQVFTQQNDPAGFFDSKITELTDAQTVSLQNTAEKSIAVENPLAIVQAHIRTPNQDYIDEQTVNQAKSLVANGQENAAINLLLGQIDQGSFPLSETYLLDIYLQQKNTLAMQQLLDRSSLADFRKTYYQARILVSQGDSASAITRLESQLVNAKQDENFRALLAGLYQREGYSLQAITAYRNLLQDFTPQPAYWLGLALSLDEQNQKTSAIYAYQKLLEFNAIDTQVAGYAQRRITELSL